MLEHFGILELANAIAVKLSHECLSFEDLHSLIAILTSTLCNAKEYYNASQPISRLPSEILCSIFQCLPRVDDNENILWPMSLQIEGRHSIAQVCRHWRNAALSYPLLWADIDVSHYNNCDQVSWLLEHSQHAPLHLIAHLRDNTLPQNLKQMVQAQMSRVQELHVLQWAYGELHWQHFQDLFFPDNNFSALNLESLSIITKRDVFRPYTELNADVAPPLLCGHVPNLQRLSLGTHSWLVGNQCKRLTHLCLSGCHKITLSALMTVLSANPLLQELILYDCSTPETSFPDVASIRLDHMCRLVLGDSEDDCGHEWMHWLIGQIEFGPTTSVRITTLSYADLLKTIRITDYPQGFMYEIHAIAALADRDMIGSTKDAAVGFRVDDTDTGYTSSSVMNTILRYPLHSVREFWLSANSELRLPIKALQTLEVLVLCHEGVDRMLATFSNLRPNVPPLPKLKAVYIFVHKYGRFSNAIARKIGDLATMFAARPCPPLTVFEIGFPSIVTRKWFEEADVLPRDGQYTTYDLRLYSEMPSFKMPRRASTMIPHSQWPSWAKEFPFCLSE